MFITGTIAISIKFFFYINECFTIYWSNIAKLEALRFWITSATVLHISLFVIKEIL